VALSNRPLAGQNQAPLERAALLLVRAAAPKLEVFKFKTDLVEAI
jgi:hypothetical protein